MTVATTSRRKAAVALVALGADRAARLLATLDEHDVRLLAAEIAALGPVSPAEVRAALGDLAAGLGNRTELPAPGPSYARDLLVRALGHERGERLAAESARPRPFGWLATADPGATARALSGEPPAAVALALALAEPRAAAKVLVRLPDDLRRDVAARVAGLGGVHPDTIAEVDAALRSRARLVSTPGVPSVEGPSVLAGLLQNTSRDDERAVLDAVAAAAPALAEAVRDALFTFDDVAALDPRTIQAVLKSVDMRVLATALKGAPDDVVTRFLGNLSERARESLLEEIDLLQAVKASDITDARTSIVAVARRLENEGVITIARGDDAG